MKKNLQSGLDAILNPTNSSETENQEQNKREKATTETVCFRCEQELIGKVRYIAAAERLSLKDVMEAALEAAVSKYEAKHGEIVKPQHGKKEDLFK